MLFLFSIFFELLDPLDRSVDVYQRFFPPSSSSIVWIWERTFVNDEYCDIFLIVDDHEKMDVKTISVATWYHLLYKSPTRTLEDSRPWSKVT
jgi:hypothetical protein